MRDISTIMSILVQQEMRAVVGIVRARRDQFDGIRAEHCQIADVLFELRRRPAIVGIDLGAIAESGGRATDTGARRPPAGNRPPQ